MRHEMSVAVAGTGLEAIVDPTFAEQFAVAHPTQRYAQVPTPTMADCWTADNAMDLWHCAALRKSAQYLCRRLPHTPSGTATGQQTGSDPG